MDEIKKLKKFKEAVFAEVDAEASKILAEAEAACLSELEQLQASRLAENSHAAIEQEQNLHSRTAREAAKYAFDAKRQIINRRNELFAALLAQAEERLDAFHRSDAYKDYLCRALQDFAAQYPLQEVCIALSPADLADTEVWRQAYALPCRFEADEKNRLGGFCVTAAKEGLFFDETIQGKLEEQRAFLMEESGFALANGD